MKAVIFDMDGVIIDSEPIHYYCSNKLLEKHDVVIERGQYDSYIGGSCKTMWNDIINEHGLPHTAEQIISEEYEIFLEYLANGKGKIQPIEGIRPLVAKLLEEKMTMALASSSALDNINTVLDLFELQHAFEHKVSGMTLKRTKPDPEIFILTAEKLGLEPKDCIVIEDSSNGVKAAKAAGMKCIGFRNPECGTQELGLADAVVGSITEITPDFMRQLFK